ncbi:protein-glutamine gamma-glutamyltransferase 2 [Hippoglossus hippoglossus]|uniref:protein-glutamine gamma-glutamyltransferase 2 n=1 Tax=Hippoglossus hippoglossus TaxID=8267 RepID=UPI00148B9A1E|nr:protein-glutamine gamma-glutamyltransferase 2 [Hippoglossus hippoglossus]
MANHNGLITNVDVRSHENNLLHRTREIDRERLIVRRGQPFSISLQCSDSLTLNDHLELVLHLGKNDEVVIKVQKEFQDGDKWWFNQQGAQDEILLTLHSPADAIIGEYHLTVSIMSSDGHIVKKTEKIGFHLLFNPWCRDDAVYHPDEKMLQEYIMNEDGIIYMGAWNDIRNKPWNYGQFEDYVMDICFKVLDNSKDAVKNSKMDIEKRSDPVYVSRMITAMVNSNGDKGVLTGQWQEPYTGGFAPNRWTGSVPILQQWSKGGSVKYGQCWVFAAVACTVLRCLGIPTRHITNFDSAHDVDGNLSIDIMVNERMESVGKKDSSWNFHCWVESWMRRDDLPQGNGGWQVLDPTPQELSDGEFCCGPCPLNAIKEGNLNAKYDAPFVFAEVNADIVYWMVGPDGHRRKIKAEHSSVGKNISTKSVYGDYREDVTQLYKYPEGSKKEREVYEKAGHRVTEPIYDHVEPRQLQLHLSIKHGKPIFGTDFDVIVEVKNDGREEVNAQLIILAAAVTYNSIYQGECQRKATRVTVPAHKTHKEVLRLRYDEYVNCVSEHHLIRVKALVEVPGEYEPVMTVTNIPLSMPELLVQVSGSSVVQEKVTALISFTNPLPVPLKRGMFTVEGSGLLLSSAIYVKGDIAPGQKVAVKISFSPMRVGVRKLLVDFDSDRLKDVKGIATVVVRKRNVFSRFY